MKETKKQLKYFFATIHKDVLRMILIGGLLMAIVLIVEIIVAVGGALHHIGRVARNDSGMLIIGFGILMAVFIVGEFLRCSNRHIRHMFSFPINRKSYALGNLIYLIVIAPCLIISITSLFYGIETLCFEILSRIMKSLYFIQRVTISSYLLGLIPTYACVIGGLSMVYLVSMIFHRYKIQTIIGVIALLVVTYAVEFNYYINWVDLFSFSASHYTLPFITLVYLIMGVVSHGLAYLPLSRMEVR